MQPAPRPDQAIREVHQQRALSNALDSCVLPWTLRGDIDPLSALIITRVPESCRPVAILLAALHCRYSELERLDMTALIERRLLQIHVLKRGISHTCRPRPLGDAILWQEVFPDAPLASICYDTMCERIRIATRRAAIPHLDGILSATHTFRHLWASWRASKGDDITAIASALGHRSPTSAHAYIHDAYYGQPTLIA